MIHIVRSLGPHRVLDVGKGFGKYGFLIHEYVGIDSEKAPTHELALKDQSSVVMDCVDIRGFGSAWIKRVRRIVRCLRDELRRS